MVPAGQSDQVFTQSLGRRCDGVLNAIPEFRLKDRFDFLKNDPGKQVIPIEVHVHMFVEQLLARCGVRYLLAQFKFAFRIRQEDTLALSLSSDPANGFVDPGICAEPQGIEIAGLDEVFASLVELFQRPIVLGQAKVEIGKSVVIAICLEKLLNGADMLARRCKRTASPVKVLPLGQIRLREIRPVYGGKRRIVLQVRRYCTEDDTHATPTADIADVGQVLAKVAVNPLQAWVISRDLVTEKHLHPLPLCENPVPAYKPSQQALDQLPCSGQFEARRRF